MASLSSRLHNQLSHTLQQLEEACCMTLEWNSATRSAEDYLTSPTGMQLLAASCMMIESIGEGVKKIDKMASGFLESNCPAIPWRSIKGMRDHIAHGYFNIDAEVVFDVVSNELNTLRQAFHKLRALLEKEEDIFEEI